MPPSSALETNRSNLEYLVELSAVTLNASGFAVYLRNTEGNALHQLTAYGEAKRFPSQVSKQQDLIGRVFETGYGELIEDYQSWTERTLGDDIGCAMASPIRVSNVVAGVIIATHQRPSYFQAWHQLQLEQLVSFAASSIENGFLRSSLSQQTEARSQAETALFEFDERLRLFESAVVNADESVLITEVAFEPGTLEDSSDTSSKIVFVNEAFTRTMGYNPEEVIGRSPSLFRGLESDPAPYKHVKQELLLGHSVMVETLEYRRDGAPIWVQLSVVPIRNAEGHYTHRVSWRRDITERKRNELLEAQRNEVLELALQGVPLPETLQAVAALLERIYPASTAGAFVRRNDRLALLAAPRWRALVRSLLDGIPVGMGHGSASFAVWQGLSAAVEDVHHDPRWEKVDRALLKSGIQASWAAPVQGADGEVIGALELHFEQPMVARPGDLERLESVARLCTLVIERNSFAEKLSLQASRDSLTSLPNRFGIERHLEALLGIASRRGSRLAVLQIGLDGFRQINGTLGQEVGDEVLRAVTERWRSILPSRDTLARTGGDEFALICGHIEDAREAQTLAKQMLEVLHQPFELRGVEFFLSASIGIALYPDDAQTANLLLRNADTAMSNVKRHGKNAAERFNPVMNSAAKERLELEVAMRRALERDEFEIRYQPQVNASAQIVSLEALLYWQHPREGLITPGRFIALAEESGLIVPLGTWILEKSCAQIAEWRREGMQIGLGVNVDVQQLMRPDFADIVARVLRETGLDPSALELEITESVVMKDFDAAVDRLHRLRNLGLQISIDDFGTGYSSLAYLQRLPVNTLKIDRSFISSLEPNDSNWSVVQLIIMLARHLRLGVVAEGVETRAQFDALKDLSVDRVQGFYFAKPTPSAELLPRLRGQPHKI
jgi:diguanylate cyclase (GGDEF)-like protein/PAS domain S-box-containing protein